jgi:serine/threonine protein kinase
MSSNEDTLDLEIWDTTEAPASSLRPSEPPPPHSKGSPSVAPAAAVYPSVPPLGGQTFLGPAPVPHTPVQASSVAPPRHASAAPGPAEAPSVPPPGEPGRPEASVDARTPIPRGVLAPGEQFGVYRVGQCIGEGGMARIYQAEHAGLRRQVALKVLLDASTRAPEGRERFLREARIAAAIKHPNVVNIFDVGVHEDTAFLVMELLKGTDLEQLIESRGALDEGTIVDIMVPVVAGLAAVHDAGVVHRDLKPGNVFLAQGLYDEVDPKLLDFGICKAPGPEQLRLTGNGMLIGTPFYMSPEGLRGEEMTPSSDQYSLGVVMYECATGVNPFGADTFAEIFRLIGAGQYPPPSATKPQISKRLERIIMRAMSLDPAARFKDLREMGRELLTLAGQRTRITWSLSFGELERLKGSATSTWKVPERSSPSSPPPPSGGKGRRRTLALLALALLMVTAALIMGLSAAFSSPPDRDAKKPVQAATMAAAATLAQPVQGPAELSPPSSAVAPPAREAKADIPTTARATPVHHIWQRRQHPAPGGVQSLTQDDQDPDWAIPATSTANQVRPVPSRVQTGVGANGAPIFD